MSRRSYLSYINPARWFRRRPTVGVVRLAGSIGLPSPLSSRGLSISSLAGPLDRAFALKNLRAVALAINSPGGSAVQSSLIAERIPYMHHFAAGMTNHEEDIEGLEENGLHTDEVASPDFGGMPMEKAPPPG